jgi:hypothetical protein
MRFLALIVSAGLVISQTACSDSGLKAAAKAELDISTGCSTAFTVVATANTQGLISTPDAMAIMQILSQVEYANAQAEKSTASLTTLNAAGAATITQEIGPIQTAVTSIVQSGLPQIKDVKTKADVLAALTLVNTGITTVLTIVQGVK